MLLLCLFDTVLLFIMLCVCNDVNKVLEFLMSSYKIFQYLLSKFLRWNLIIFIPLNIQTIVFNFIVMLKTFWPMCPLAFFRCFMSNLWVYTDLQTKPVGVDCSNSINHSPWCNGYRHRKWTRRYEFKSWTRPIAFHIALIPLGKVWIQLFPLQLWVNSRTDWVLQPWWGN